MNEKFSLLISLAMSAQLTAFEPNAVELEIAELAANDSKQKRAQFVYDPILSEVARARAVDMATRNYVSHTNPDGLGPNKLAQLAGYEFPEFWGTANTTNYIESIAAGITSASAAWSGWRNSSGHRRHVLGESDFYKIQTRYGIGYAYDSASRYKRYYVFITAPPSLAASDSFTEWKGENLQAGAPDDSDFDGDRIPLLVEFALDMDPTKRDTMPSPRYDFIANQLVWNLPLRDDLGSVDVEVQKSTNLKNWSSNGVLQNGKSFIVPTEEPRLFLKVKVEREETSEE